MKQISLFYAENVLKMRKMRKSANYAVPHHRILSDALLDRLNMRMNENEYEKKQVLKIGVVGEAFCADYFWCSRLFSFQTSSSFVGEERL